MLKQRKKHLNTFITCVNKKAIFFTLLLYSCWFSAIAQIDYPFITAQKQGPANRFSPDPLIEYRWKDPKASDELEIYYLDPVSYKTSTPASFNMKRFINEKVIKVQGTGSIRFDFGRTSAGWLEFESNDPVDSITMSISEYNEPAIVNNGSFERIKTKSPVKKGNTYRLELNPELYEGVRFGWINVHSHSQTFHIRNVRLVCQVKPVNYRGSFSASDSELTRIWYTGAYTVKLCLQKDHFGAILMERSDRHSWTGDAYPAQAASMVAFGNFDFVKANLMKTAVQDNGIASYALYWVLSLIDYVNYTGDVQFARDYISNAIQKLDSAYQHFGRNKYLVFHGWDERLGAGFENPNIPESQYSYAMLSIRSWLEFGRLMQQIGEAELSTKYLGYATQKMAEARKMKPWPLEYGLHASADAINTGLTSPGEEAMFYKRHFLDRVNRLSYSPFNQYLVIGAMARMGKYDDALHSIKDVWGGQIRYGGTTFFEVFRPSWNSILAKNDAPPNGQAGYTSLTHPWSSGVVKWLSEETLGIKPLEPGFKTFEIIPHLGESLTWVKGSTPTSAGTISAEFNTSTGLSTFIIPPNTFAKQVCIPLGGSIAKSVFLNNKLIWQAGKSINGNDFKVSGNSFCLNNLKPGNYACKIIYRKIIKPAIVKELEWVYPINSVKQDSLTSGNWKTKYGSDGFILFNYKGNNQHFQQLPAYITSFTVKKAANLHLNLPEIGDKVLVTPEANDRHFGAIITQDPEPTLQTMTIDLDVKDSQKRRLALYFLDWDSNGRRSAVEIFDLKTLKLVAPVQPIREYQSGKYLVFDYEGSLRIRVNHVRGENAALCGIFFDGTGRQPDKK
ncbi:MAG TPA: alpha-L-rhamnosidase C-terminal domain-containing protein [Chitinophagaceae bacterium]|nr:alpha-L-rhamnosidase C-terminal domain-containing protein [Chitinophagaceae bacterium]